MMKLTPAQMKNLEQELGFNVLDRTMVILDIFASRARSSEGKFRLSWHSFVTVQIV